ncbi:MAG: hypothetical protein ACYC1T_11550 [Sulfuricaulis sp.]
MNQMKKMMEKMMSAMVKPEDMPQMMGAMMDRMFSQMSSEDRIAFVTTMMPKCLSLIFAEIGPEAKEKLPREMIGKMVSILEGQINQKTSS